MTVTFGGLADEVVVFGVDGIGGFALFGGETVGVKGLDIFLDLAFGERPGLKELRDGDGGGRGLAVFEVVVCEASEV